MNYWRNLWLALLWAFTASLCYGDEIAVNLTGKGIVAVITEFPKDDPPTVEVPGDGSIYAWWYPDSFTVRESRNKLQILDAPKGSYLVKVKYWKLSVKGNEVETKEFQGNIKVNVQTTPTPPSDDFGAKLKQAFEADGNGKAEKIRFIDFFRTAAKVVSEIDPKILNTSGLILLKLRGLAKDSYWDSDDLMPRTRQLCFDHLALSVDLNPQAEVTDEVLERWSKALNEIADEFERMK